MTMSDQSAADVERAVSEAAAMLDRLSAELTWQRFEDVIPHWDARLEEVGNLVGGLRKYVVTLAEERQSVANLAAERQSSVAQ